MPQDPDDAPHRLGAVTLQEGFEVHAVQKLHHVVEVARVRASKILELHGVRGTQVRRCPVARNGSHSEYGRFCVSWAVVWQRELVWTFDQAHVGLGGGPPTLAPIEEAFREVIALAAFCRSGEGFPLGW